MHERLGGEFEAHRADLSCSNTVRGSGPAPNRRRA